MDTIDTRPLFTLWLEHEKKIGRRLSLREVSRATGLSVRTVSDMRDGKARRFDVKTLINLCRFFGIESGVPIPFILFIADPGKPGDLQSKKRSRA